MQGLLALFRVNRGDQHAAALQAHHLPGGQVHNGHQRLADQVLRLVPLVDAREDLPVHAGAVVQGKAQQLLALLYRLAGLHLHGPEIALAEGVKVHLFLQLGLHLDGGQLGFGGSLLHGGDLFHHLAHVQPGKEDFRLVRHFAAAGIQASLIQILPIPCLGVELGQDLLCRLRHKGLQQAGAQSNAVHQVVEHLGQPGLLFLVLGQGPGHGLVDILVAALEQGEDLRNGVGHPQAGHLFRHLVPAGGGHSLQVLVHGLGDAGAGHNAVKILVAHRDSAVDQVAQHVGQVRVGPLAHQLPGQVAVVVIGHLVQEEVPHRIHAEHVHQVVGVNDIPLRFAHLAPVHQQPGVAEHLLGQGQIQGHQEDGPVDGVEPDDVLAD